MSEIKKTYVSNTSYPYHEYRNNKGSLHRLDGPAKEYDDGDCIWYVNGDKHREDGPAVEYYTTKQFHWWLNDTSYSFEIWCEILEKSEEEINYLRLKYNV